MAWKKAMDLKKPYENKFRKKKKHSKKKDHLAKAVERLENKAKSKSNVFISKSYPTLTYDSDLEIRDSLYTHESEENVIPEGPPYPYKPLQRRTSNIENYMAEKYLDKMYIDKLFLKNLKKCDGIRSANQKGTKDILKLAKEGYKALCYKQVRY